MKITRSPAFYCVPCFSSDNCDWRKHLSLKDIKTQHDGWEFKEMPHAYRFIDPWNRIAKYYNKDGSIIEIPCAGINFQEA